jgi:hypothetical protein
VQDGDASGHRGGACGRKGIELDPSVLH